MKPRIVHLVNSLATGGIETQLSMLLPELMQSYDIIVITLRERGRLAEQIEAHGIKVILCDVERGGWWSKVGRLAKVLAAQKPSIVHAHSRFPALVGGMAAYACGASRRILHYYSIMSSREWSIKDRRNHRWLLRHNCNLAFCSEDVREDFTGIFPEFQNVPIHILPCGVDLDRFRPMNPQRRGEERACRGIADSVGLLGIVARLNPVKNHPLLLEAARRLKNRGVKFQLCIIGPGTESEVNDLHRHIEELALAADVEYRGYCSDLPGEIGLLDAFVLCSRSEGMPLSVLEAWACGVPVVATRVPGLRGLVRHQIDGLLCEKLDPDALADALERILSDRALRRGMSNQALLRSQDFSIGAVAGRLAALYDAILARPATDSPWTRRWIAARAARAAPPESDDG